MKKILLWLLAGSMLGNFPAFAQSDRDHNIDYPAAVADAAKPEKDEIHDGLFALNADNDRLVRDDSGRVLVVAWKSQGEYINFIKPNSATSEEEDYVLWVTLVPQVQEFCRNYAAMQGEDLIRQDLELRLKQYLGLNPEWIYDLFVELWVHPEDLFRPCVDPETDDTVCKLDFSKKPPQLANIADYPGFYRNLYYKNFRGSAGMAWTGLGYTYDWGNPDSEVGASEYVLVPKAEYEVEQVVPAMEYCAAKAK